MSWAKMFFETLDCSVCSKKLYDIKVNFLFFYNFTNIFFRLALRFWARIILCLVTLELWLPDMYSFVVFLL